MHAEHFLERLDRLDDHEVPDALALYYDPPLVRQLLAHAPERGHGDRVAISIDDPREGPFIIVTQNGDFVTTLGRGMSVGDLPVVPRSVWDAARREDERVHEAFALARAASNGKVRRLWDEVTTRGPCVSREAMAATVALGRLMEGPFIRLWAKLNITFADALTRMCTRDGFRSFTREGQVEVARVAWTVGHLSVIIGASEVKRQTEGPVADVFRSIDLSALALRFGMVGPYLRALWTMGKLGPLAFPLVKNTFRTGTTSDDLYGSALGLATIGLRFRKYRGEVAKLLAIGPREHEDQALANRRAVGQMALTCLEKVPTREEARATLQVVGAALWVGRCRKLPPDHPLRMTSPDEVPAELAVPLFASMCVDLWTLGFTAAPATALLASAMLDAEELHFPRAVADAMPTDGLAAWGPLCCVRLRKDATRARPSVTAAPKPARNDPCSCGSGQKYKRCCGR